MDMEREFAEQQEMLKETIRHMQFAVEALEVWHLRHQLHCPAASGAAEDGDCAEPANALAYAAHCLGLKVKDVPKFAHYLDIYERNCPQCPHHRN